MTGIAGAVMVALSLLVQVPVEPAGEDVTPVARKTAKAPRRKAAPPQESAEKTATPEAGPAAPLSNAVKEVTSGAWVGDEDLLFIFQSFCALGAASAVGAVALLPAHAVFFGVLLGLSIFQPTLSLGAAPVVAVPVMLLGLTLLLQAGVVGLTLWGVGLTSEHFKAPNLAPPWLQNLLQPSKDTFGADVVRAVTALPWLPGAIGYVVGAGLGLGVGLALAAPLVAASLALFSAPVGNVPGILALLAALTAGAIVVAAAETLIAPPIAALAWHFSKVPTETPAPSP